MWNVCFIVYLYWHIKLLNVFSLCSSSVLCCGVSETSCRHVQWMTWLLKWMTLASQLHCVPFFRLTCTLSRPWPERRPGSWTTWQLTPLNSALLFWLKTWFLDSFSFCLSHKASTRWFSGFLLILPTRKSSAFSWSSLDSCQHSVPHLKWQTQKWWPWVWTSCSCWSLVVLRWQKSLWSKVDFQW